MSGILVPLCPAIPAMLYQATPVRQANLAPAAIEHLEKDPAVVVTGRNHHYWDLNKRLYKTTTVRNRLIPRLRKLGQSVSYLNVQKVIRRRDLVGHTYYKFEPLLRRVHAMRNADVYVLDEIHHALPFRNGARNYGIRSDLYVRTTMAFWGMVANHLERGGRIVYVTAVHPLNPDYEGALFNEAIASFFTAPVVELGLGI
jgi:hypothetical protein